MGSIGGLDDREAGKRAEPSRRADRVPLHPRNVHLVMRRPERGTSVPLRVLVDGEPPGDDHGARRRRTGPRNPGPTAVLSADSPAGLDHRPHLRDHLPRPGVEAYVFIFGEAAYSTSSADRYEQPEEPHRMTRGGSSCSRTFSSSVRPSVWSAPRVSSGRRRGSLDQAVPLISITTCATCAPRVISQSQLCPSAPARAYLPRFALISQLTTARLGARARRVHLARGPRPTNIEIDYLPRK